MVMIEFPRCDVCGDKGCKAGQPGKFRLCPTNISQISREDILKKYQDPEDERLLKAAAKVERETLQPVNGVLTPIRPRISEIMAFADELGIKKIGVSFCIAARDEAERLCKVLETRGFEVHSVICRNFALTKAELGIPKEHVLRSETETSCNPILQAELLNDAGTELNIVVGLCIGHDILFSKHSKGYVTTLMVKDRMTGNNPTDPLYSPFFVEILKK